MARLALAAVAAAALAAAPHASAAPAAADVPLPLPPGDIAGRVVDAAGKPIPVFTVNDRRFAARDGAFDVLAPIGDFRIVVRAAGFAPAFVAVHATASGTSGRRFVLPDIVMGPGEDRFGEVVDAETELPVVLARAAIVGPADAAERTRMSPDRLSDVASSGFGGVFLVKRAARTPALLVVTHPDYLPEVVRVPSKGLLPTIKLHRGGSIAGVARGPNGAPLAGASVLAVSQAAQDGREVRAGADGAFRVDRLRPGRYTILVRPARGGPATYTEAVRVKDGALTSVDLAPSGHALAAR